MKKSSIVFIGCLVFILALSLSSFAVELSKDNLKKIPPNFAKAEKDKIVFGKSTTAYSPDEFNQILEAYGGTLSPDAVKANKVPKTYAKLDKDKIVFGKDTAAYDPGTLNKILESYGFTLSPEAVKGKKVPNSYAKLDKDKIVFGKDSTAYSADELDLILKAYQGKTEVAQKPVEKAVEKPVEKAIEKPIEKAPVKKAGRCPFDPPKGAKLNDAGCWEVKGLQFDTAKWDIKPQFYPNLDEIVTILKENPDLYIRVDGHTDSRGKAASNMKLSQNRADSVRSYFIKKGIDPQRLSTRGFGQTVPVAPNNSDANLQKNRRVELTPSRTQFVPETKQKPEPKAKIKKSKSVKKQQPVKPPKAKKSKTKTKKQL